MVIAQQWRNVAVPGFDATISNVSPTTITDVLTDEAFQKECNVLLHERDEHPRGGDDDDEGEDNHPLKVTMILREKTTTITIDMEDDDYRYDEAQFDSFQDDQAQFDGFQDDQAQFDGFEQFDGYDHHGLALLEDSILSK